MVCAFGLPGPKSQSFTLELARADNALADNNKTPDHSRAYSTRDAARARANTLFG
jgi:hypothetical protein